MQTTITAVIAVLCAVVHAAFWAGIVWINNRFNKKGNDGK